MSWNFAWNLRDNSLIPWDNDIDIGSWDIKNKNKIIQSFIKKGFIYRNKILETIT